jgi:hypothetical protein
MEAATASLTHNFTSKDVVPNSPFYHKHPIEGKSKERILF